MIHPNTELRLVNPQVGYGVFATAFIPEGTIVYVKDSLEIEVSPQDYIKHSKSMQDQIEKYSYIDERGYRIISWDFAKYVNHCCNCNTISTGYGFEIAIRDIFPGEELTDDYGYLNVEQPFHAIDEGTARKTVYPDDILNFHEEWDALIKTHAPTVLQVDQPLLNLIPKSVWDDFVNGNFLKAQTLRNHVNNFIRQLKLNSLPTMERKFTKREIYAVDYGVNTGSEINGIRPSLIYKLGKGNAV